MSTKLYYQSKPIKKEKINKVCIEKHTICVLVEDWLVNPRRRHKKNESQQKNIRQALNKFRPILDKYAPRDLEDDDIYFDFIQWFKEFIEQTVATPEKIGKWRYLELVKLFI